MSIQVSIQAVHEREILVEKLLERLGEEFDAVRVFYDNEHRGSWWNLQRILRNTDSVHTHHLVLQDDVVISEGFGYNVGAIGELMKGKFVTFFANRKEVKDALDKGLQWAPLSNFLGGQAVMFPCERINDFLCFVDNYPWTIKMTGKNFWKHDDIRLQLYLKEKKERIWCTVPNLVEHSHVQSVIGNHSRIPNRARVFDINIGKKEWKL